LSPGVIINRQNFSDGQGPKGALMKGGLVMTNDKEYPSCNIAGNGKLEILSSGKTIPFKLISMSAVGALIGIGERMNISSKVKIQIVLKSYIFNVRINVEGIVKTGSQSNCGYQYEISFTSLSEDDKNEINELLLSSFDLSYV